MFNTSYYHAGNHTYTNNIKINAVTGAILKNHPKSWFERFNLNSDRATQLLTEGGDSGFEWVNGQYSRWQKNNPEKAITVLQMVICGDMEVMAELVYTKDYNVTEVPQEWAV